MPTLDPGKHSVAIVIVEQPVDRFFARQLGAVHRTRLLLRRRQFGHTGRVRYVAGRKERNRPTYVVVQLNCLRANKRTVFATILGARASRWTRSRLANRIGPTPEKIRTKLLQIGPIQPSHTLAQQSHHFECVAAAK